MSSFCAGEQDCEADQFQPASAEKEKGQLLEPPSAFV